MSDELTVLQPEQVPLERDSFLRTLLRHLAGTLEEVVGLDEAAGMVSLVGQEMGAEIGGMYRAALGQAHLNRSQVGAVLVDLKRRIQGDFRIVSEDDEKIVLANRACPFGDKVVGRPALCMMTSNVFGSISAHDLGYAKVELRETIATGSPGCTVVVYLTHNDEASQAPGREYYRTAAHQ